MLCDDLQYVWEVILCLTLLFYHTHILWMPWVCGTPSWLARSLVHRYVLCDIFRDFNVHGFVHCKNILIYIQQDATLRSLFYLETALHVSGGITTHHQEHKQLYLQHLIFVMPLLLPAAIVEELELHSKHICMFKYGYPDWGFSMLFPQL